ncbi:MAG: hypothetical protein LUE13_09230 [Akkermansiaceae bacterium]|nr:hypothetical protein [Akkermansiaceae bacterium]
MYHLPKKTKGSVLTSGNWNNNVEAVLDALNRTSNFNSMLPSVPASGHWTGGRYVDDKGGFSLRSLIKEGEKWMAYFNPGRVLEIHAGGTRNVIPKIGGAKMNADPYPGLKAEVGKVYLDLVWGDMSHDCITDAVISTSQDKPGGRAVRLVLGEFVSGAGSSGSSIDDITYKPYLTGCITYAANSLDEGWRVLVTQGEAYVKQGDIYINGVHAKEGSGAWEKSDITAGDLWLHVTCDDKGQYKSHNITSSKGEESPLKTIAEKEKEENGEYFFKLAMVEILPEPLVGDGNAAELVTVKQYVLGAVYCGLKASPPYNLKTDPKCALEIRDEGEDEHVLTLNIESSSEDVTVTTELKAWLVQEKGKGESGEDEGPVKLGVRIVDGRPDYNGLEPIEIIDKDIALKIDKVVHSTPQGIKYNLEIRDGELAMRLDTDSMTGGDAVSYTAEDPIEIVGSSIKLKVNTTQKTSNGLKYGLTKTGGQLDISIDATSLSSGTLSALMPLEIADNQVRLRYASYWKTPTNGKGIRTRLWTDNNFLSVDLDVSSFEAVSRVCDSWTTLACDSNYALRPQHTSDGDLYIQMGRWDEISEEYISIN